MVDQPASTLPSLWLDKGLLLSSFTDGLVNNPPALDWFMSSLVEVLWEEEQALMQTALEESNLFSPCNGPDPDLLGQLEETDRVVEQQRQNSGPEVNKDWKERLGLLCQTKRDRQLEDAVIDLRILYIPTAMYALRPGSTSKPGKQRGRNRADGKKRRDMLERLITQQLVEFGQSGLCTDDDLDIITMRTVTMDLDDSSVKQPHDISFGTDSRGYPFPESGREAIHDWKPHLIYVQGGNTFWLHHCIEKGDWAKDLIDACCRNYGDSTTSSPPSFSAVYCGVSAGSIIAGESMQTACWKEWDDPSVVPGKETYGDWADSKGLVAAGRTSLFPHMTEEWQVLTEQKTKELLDSMAVTDGDKAPPSVRCIRDDQAYVVDGRTQTIVEL